MTQNCRGKRGLPVIKSTLLKGKLRDLSGRALGGSRRGIHKWFMGIDDLSHTMRTSLFLFGLML